MAKYVTCVLMCILLNVARSVNEFSDRRLLDGMSIQSMAKTFSRSEKVHQQSMASISRSLSLEKSVQVLRKHHKLTPSLAQVTSMVLRGHSHLRKQPKGYSGVDGARKLLNDMIFEAQSKYDQEIAKCTDYYSQQCAAMEVCRGQIAAANYVAANSRALILDAQANINRCEVDIPTRRYELKQHLLKCKAELYKLNTRLKIVLGDIAVMTMILEMTDCDKSFLQTHHMSMLHCQDPCTNKTFVTFDHKGLQQQVSKLKSDFANDLMKNTFTDLFEGIESMELTEFLQIGSEQTPIVNKTQFNNPPVPVTKVPGNPCTDPFAGAPSPNDKRAAKCTIRKSPQCYKLQERFLLIQSGISDERDELMEEISMLEHYCEETKKTLETQISNDQDLLAESQTKLAIATQKEATAGETARTTAIENSKLNEDLLKQMKTCSSNYINAETELCALKKIRGELYKLKGTASPFFQDCEVSKWDPEECTKTCAGGEQKLTRNVLTHPDGGAKCLPLAAIRSCNDQPCPVDCELAAWSGWSKCSAECGGGVTQRLREVKMAMKYGGHPCGSTSETRSCSNQACEKDCDLSDWTKWSTCSKDCDGGTQKRLKFITHEAEGHGKCADEWSVKRLQYKNCNMKRCETLSVDKPLTCNRTLDVILLIDGSGSLGKEGWESEIHAAKSFIGAFEMAEQEKVQMAVILFSGPRTWSGVSKCVGKNQQTVSLEECGIKTVTHFTDDLTKVDQLVTGLDWPQGSTLTSLALMTAKAEMALGRADEHTVVVVFTDGRPLSFRKTGLAAHTIRKAARLLWVPVTKFAPLKKIKKWATRRWQENIVQVKDFTELKQPDVITHIIADICPKKDLEMEFTRR
eukprot:CAMPEP_0169226004 /NCGR_PEP_ID=MMETSP1016-20121227/23508_1 /TAXON_ID=342587 /ORGANISM="Karlodinium micrum, Strain CCMP2283" /LENGTH=858 /DNA_ID=CAMNT_0009304565 /DNA_START=23 /DNA_END=2599 /DNA_ORIENTATION=+